MNEFDEQISDSLKRTIREFIANETLKRQINQLILNHESSLRWLNEQLVCKKLSQKNIAEYRHKIKYHELSLTCLRDEYAL